MSFKRYEGEFRQEISFPVGGIGTGCLGLDGYGRLVDWEIFNRPNKRSLNGYSHFAVKAEADGKVLDARVMNADALPSYMGDEYRDAMSTLAGTNSTWRSNYGFGPQRSLLSGIPHFEGSVFEAEFPFAKISFSDSTFPGKVEINAFNPMIPQNEDDSSIPAAFYTVNVFNNTEKTLDYTVALSLGNPQIGEHYNEAFAQNGARGVSLSNENANQDDPLFGQIVMAVPESENVNVQRYWFRGRWFDDLSVFWHDFTTFGPIRERIYDDHQQWKNNRDTSTLTVTARLLPGESRAFRFVIGWYFPTCVNYWDPVRDDEDCPKFWKNEYARRFENAKSVAAYAIQNWKRLENETKAFSEALSSSDLPEEALDAVTANLEVLKSPTCLRLPNGEFYGFEGCHMNDGCCEGSCDHVWNYAFALPFLFPSLERSMRELDYTYNQHEDGRMEFRMRLPLGRSIGNFISCVDGLMGGVIKLYREWKICGDDEWLKKWWPKAKKSLCYAWSPENSLLWDPEKTGIITGRQHHTLDMELFGPNSWLNGFYIAALKAAAEISEYLGEREDAQEFRRLYENGRAFTEKELFNGEYFFQKIDVTDRTLLDRYDPVSKHGGTVPEVYWNPEAGEIKYQIQNGCGIDQVLAQWMADLCGLGDILDADKVKSALESIYRYNFKPVLREHVNPCRIYGLNDEAGTVICEWPEGVKKPVIPVPYAEETMHGFEYQAASHLIARGLEEKGLRMVKAVRDRYDGRRRNPWNEMECGSNYARSMASYALLLVYSGLKYDMPKRRMGFLPLKGEGNFFWSLEGAWGTVEVFKEKTVLKVIHGKMNLKSFVCPLASRSASAKLEGKTLDCEAKENEVIFKEEISVGAGESLTVQIA